MLSKDLQKFGLGRNEALVYLALFELGDAKAGEIISKTGLHRNIVYMELEKLKDKHLIMRSNTSGVAVFKTLDPSRLLDELRERQTFAKSIIEELRHIQRPVQQEIIVYEGLKGFRDYNFTTLEKIPEGGALYVMGSIGDKWYELMGEDYFRYERLRLKKGIIWKMISYSISQKDAAMVKNQKFCEMKVLPQIYKNPANMNIFENTIALQTFVEPYSVIEIKNSALAEVYKYEFNLLWNQTA